MLTQDELTELRTSKIYTVDILKERFLLKVGKYYNSSYYNELFERVRLSKIHYEELKEYKSNTELEEKFELYNDTYYDRKQRANALIRDKELIEKAFNDKALTKKSYERLRYFKPDKELQERFRLNGNTYYNISYYESLLAELLKQKSILGYDRNANEWKEIKELRESMSDAKFEELFGFINLTENSKYYKGVYYNKQYYTDIITKLNNIGIKLNKYDGIILEKSIT
jgi:hypothetical protein